MTAATFPIKHKLSPKQLEAFGKEMDAIREEVVNDLGERDARYIKNIIRIHRGFEASGRILIHFSITPIGWSLGSLSLGISKILENMEIGHNVLHGQYDWMNDPYINSQTYEWDNVCDAESWKRTHNFEHHTFTNIIGKDRDYGYTAMRLSDDEPWHPIWRLNLAYMAALSFFFQWGVGAHELEVEKLRSGEKTLKDKIPFLKDFTKKSTRQLFKDYVFFPALAGPFFWKVAAGNFAANAMRNLWASSIIFCGHFTEDAQTFTEEECENESKGHWYYRQLLGSSNFEGGRWLHVMSGHLSYQIEHHLFPDIPAHRYAEMSPKVKAVCEKYGLNYNTGSFAKQYGTVLKRLWTYSKPPKQAELLA
ncbi:MAG: acyl-CoA desaturase [Pseudomonadales bacterium]|nr:acyl-CoA desaturase [Pseudomonadales bacterium]